MKLVLYIGIAFFAVYSSLSFASEDIDPMMFFDDNTIVNPQLTEMVVNEKPDVSLSGPEMKSDLIFEDDENLDAFANEKENISSNENVEIKNTAVPMIQKRMPDSTPVPEVGVSSKSDIPEASINTTKGLTDNFLGKEPGASDLKLPIPDVGGTWINKLRSDSDSLIPTLTTGDNLEGMIESSKFTPKGRSNASVFDISGLMLRMTFIQVDDIMKKRGYKMTMQKFEVPNFIKWRNEEKCRASGVIGYERLANCVISLAKKDNHQYIESVKYSKYDTREDVQVRLTSNFTNNKVYKIMYKSMSSTITGNSPKAMYLRNIKIYDFWKKVNQKYGNPDNKDEVIWGMGGNKPYLQASTGYLMLEDPMLNELDYTRMSREDQRYMNTDLYTF